MAGKTRILRRARGFVPSPAALPRETKEILAVGGELKNTFCLTKGSYGFMSQHMGDLKDLKTLEHFKKTIESFKNLFDIKPKIIACDMHPQYLPSRYAEEQKGAKKIRVQHHHAHIASCMAENGLNEKVIGIALDGTGWGDDGLVWGGEFLIADYGGFKRAGHLQYISMQSGDASAEEPWRAALSYLYKIYGKALSKEKLAPVLFSGKARAESMADILDKKVNTIPSTSMGRFFDAVSSLLGICHENTYEGEAAMRLEAAAEEAVVDLYGFSPEAEDGLLILDGAFLIREIISDIKAKVPSSVISAKFHNSLARGILETAEEIRKLTRLNKVCLSGGCFQNKYLTEKLVQLLESNSFRVYAHSKVPTNDGGISLGQAMVANAIS